MKVLGLKKRCWTVKALSKRGAYLLFNLLSFSSLMLSQNASAALNLELTQGVANQLPIAIVALTSSESFTPENDITEVIQSDLSHSGQFKITRVKKIPPSDKAALAYWRAHHIDDVIFGKITALG